MTAYRMNNASTNVFEIIREQLLFNITEPTQRDREIKLLECQELMDRAYRKTDF